jgi:DNA polymerase I-like protein with 3'-5' exonuclease and polymerase domains
MSKTLDEDIKILETSIFETAGENSTCFTKQLGDVLFDKLKLVV